MVILGVFACLAIIVNSYVGRSVQGYLINVIVAIVCTEYGWSGVFIKNLKLLHKKLGWTLSETEEVKINKYLPYKFKLTT